MVNLKAIFPKSGTQNARNLSGDKELVSEYHVIVYQDGEFHTPVHVMCWMGRSSSASTVYASVWVSDKRGDRWFSGHGSAGGYGYHKESAAIQEALNSAGIELRGDVYGRDDAKKNQPAHIGGVGESAIRAALDAVARKCGYRKFTII